LPLDCNPLEKMEKLKSGKSPPHDEFNVLNVLEHVGKSVDRFILGTPVLGSIQDEGSAILFYSRFQDHCERDSQVSPFTFVFVDITGFRRIQSEFNQGIQQRSQRLILSKVQKSSID